MKLILAILGESLQEALEITTYPIQSLHNVILMGFPQENYKSPNKR